MQTVKSVARIEKLSVIERDEIGVDILPIERRPAENDRHVDAALIHQLEVISHYQRRLHEQAAHPDRICFRIFPCTKDVIDRLLDAEVDDLVAVVRKDDIDEVLADVVYVTLHSREYKCALFDTGDTVHKRFEELDCRLHRFGGLQHKRQLHLSAAEKVADRFHSVEENVVDDVERRVLFKSLLQRVLETNLFAVDDVMLETLLDRKICDVGLYRLCRFSFKKFCELDERIIGADVAVKFSTVVDQIARGVDLMLIKSYKRQDLRSVDDRRIHPGLDAVM